MVRKNRVLGPAVLGVAAIIGGTPATFAQTTDAELLPPDAKPGQCYARVFVPPTYRTEAADVLVREAGEKLEIVPARSEWVEERVTVKEASERIEVVPATYEWVEEQVLVKPASKKLEEVPAVYETVTEQVLKAPAHTVWKKGRGVFEKVDNGTGEVMCLVEVPAVYETVTKRVLKSPATTRTLEVPAEYKTVRKQVVKTPATTRTVSVPAEYKTVRVEREVAPAETRRRPIPAEHRTLSKTEMVTEGRMEWMPVLCETNASPELILSLQRALQGAGFDPGPIDGLIGTATLEAVRAFQQAKGLAVGPLTSDTLTALRVPGKQ